MGQSVLGPSACQNGLARQPFLKTSSARFFEPTFRPTHFVTLYLALVSWFLTQDRKLDMHKLLPATNLFFIIGISPK